MRAWKRERPKWVNDSGRVSIAGHNDVVLAVLESPHLSAGARAALCATPGKGGGLALHAACMRKSTVAAALRLVPETACAAHGLLDKPDDRGLAPLLQATASGLPQVVRGVGQG